MNAKTFKLFLVDDDPMARMIVMDELQSENYEISEYDDGAACLAALDEAPDLILMDVEMPVMDGYETCRNIKKSPETEGIDVIFISSHDSTEEKLAGYDAGGSDYLIKPIQPVEIKQKVALAIKNIELRSTKKKESEDALKAAMTAITSAGEQGVVLDFMRRSYAITTVDELAQLIIQSLLEFSLSGSVQVRTSKKVVNLGNKVPVSPLEIELLSKLKNASRIQEYNSRLFANYGDISVLIKNMPEDEEKRGRLRDNLALLLEAALARLRTLRMELALAGTVDEVKYSLGNIEQMLEDQKASSVAIIEDTMTHLEESFMTCGLTEDQEKMLLAIVHEGVNKSLDNFKQGLVIDQELKRIVAHLEASTSDTE